MTYQIHALDPTPFQPRFSLSDAQLRIHQAEWRTVTNSPGFPCRVTLQDAPVGAQVLLVNHTSVPGPSPYAATHAIFIRPGYAAAQLLPGTIPEMLKRRTLSLRAFTADMDMVAAKVTDGHALHDTLCDLLSNTSVDSVHIHNAAPGCYAACARRI